MELFAENGYENTTVAEIAERAGVTERTFFRHYADKKDVLFAGSGLLEEAVIAAVISAVDRPPIDAAMAGAEAGLRMIADGRGHQLASRRSAIVASSPELRERELIKLESLKRAVADTLRDRQTPEPTAALAAELAVAVFHIAFGRWIQGNPDVHPVALARQIREELRALAA
jgi:AcrR family transcriptional regulator